MIVTVTSVVGRSVSWQRQWYCCYCHRGWCYMYIIAAQQHAVSWLRSPRIQWNNLRPMLMLPLHSVIVELAFFS